MSDETVRVAVVGDRMAKFVAQDSIDTALQHSATALGTTVAVEWFATPKLAAQAAEQLEAFDAVWCAPGSPYLSLDGALEGIRFARETNRPVSRSHARSSRQGAPLWLWAERSPAPSLGTCA